MENLLKYEFNHKLCQKVYSYFAYYSGLNSLVQQCQTLKYGPSLKVIIYHNIMDSVHPGDVFTIPTKNFAEQIDYISKHYSVITFAEALKMTKEATIAGDCLVITFDDGYKSNITKALPILKKYGLPACFFLTTDFIGHVPQGTEREGDIWESPGMTWDDVQFLSDQGYEIGSHSRTHPNLVKLPPGAARQEILESKDRLEHFLGREIDYFSYPYGKNNAALRAVVSEGFKLCCVTTRKRNHLQALDPLEIHRICVQNWWSPFYFARELEGTFELVRTLAGHG